MDGNKSGEVFSPDEELSTKGLGNTTGLTPSAGDKDTGFFKPEDSNNGNSGYTEVTETKYPGASFDDEVVMSWTASEFVDHQKTAAWFITLGGIAVGVGIVIYLLSGDWFAPIIVVLLAIIFGFGAAKKPRELNYAITASGIRIENKLYPYTELKSYGLLREDSIESIMLLPGKRWQPAISLYVDPDECDKVIKSIGAFLPYEERKAGLADKFLNKIRF